MDQWHRWCPHPFIRSDSGYFPCWVAYIAHFAGVKLLSFWKLKPMQDRWGKVPGTVLHFVSYVVVPIALGVAFLMGYRL